MSIDQRQQFGNDFSQLFLILTTTTDRKEKINQFINNVQLHPIDIDYNEFATKNSSEKKDFNPSDLDSKNQGKRLEAREVLKNFFKDAVEISNTNLIRNSRALMATARVDNENFV